MLESDMDIYDSCWIHMIPGSEMPVPMNKKNKIQNTAVL